MTMKEKRKKNTQLSFRLNLLFFVIFLLFFGLIIQLGTIQILNGEKYEADIHRTVKDTIKIPVPAEKSMTGTITSSLITNRCML